jgi:hypothetical protein
MEDHSVQTLLSDDEEQDPIPALLRWARGAYGQAVRGNLAEAGFDDLPGNGPFVLGGMARFNGSAADMITGLGVTKQAASQLIDTLVLRGYLTREVDPEDRRRMTISLTEAVERPRRLGPQSIPSTPSWRR